MWCIHTVVLYSYSSEKIFYRIDKTSYRSMISTDRMIQLDLSYLFIFKPLTIRNIFEKYFSLSLIEKNSPTDMFYSKVK